MNASYFLLFISSIGQLNQRLKNALFLVEAGGPEKKKDPTVQENLSFLLQIILAPRTQFLIYENISMAVCCHKDGPPGGLAYWPCKWNEKHLGVDTEFELMGQEKLRLLRLRPDYQDDRRWTPRNKAEFMTVAAREALRDGHAELVGGFIRDWIIRGDLDQDHDTPKDIDLRLWESFDMIKFIDRCEMWGLEHELMRNGDNLRFRTPHGEEFQVDYVWAEKFVQRGDQGVDLDVNSFAVSQDLGLHKRAYFQRPISKTYGNIKRKTAYLVESDPGCGRCDYMKTRVLKMQGRGWKVIGSDSLHENCKNCVDKK